MRRASYRSVSSTFRRANDRHFRDPNLERRPWNTMVFTREVTSPGRHRPRPSVWPPNVLSMETRSMSSTSKCPASGVFALRREVFVNAVNRTAPSGESMARDGRATGTMNKSSRTVPERSVRLVLELQSGCQSQWAAIRSIPQLSHRACLCRYVMDRPPPEKDQCGQKARSVGPQDGSAPLNPQLTDAGSARPRRPRRR